MSSNKGYADDVGCCQDPLGAWWRIGSAGVERYCLNCGAGMYAISSINENLHYTRIAVEALV